MYRVKENNLSNKELVYYYEFDYNNSLNFYIEDKQLWYKYHVGGAVIRPDVYCKVNNNGKPTIEESDYIDFKNTSKGLLKIYQGSLESGNSLWLSLTGEERENGKNIGNPNLIYGFHFVGTGYDSNYSTTVLSDNI